MNPPTIRAMLKTLFPCVGLGGVISTILPRTSSVRRSSFSSANSVAVISFSPIDTARLLLLPAKTIHHTAVCRDHKLAIRNRRRAGKATGGLMFPYLLARLEVQTI